MAPRPDAAQNDPAIVILDDDGKGLSWDDWVAALEQDQPVELSVTAAEALREVRAADHE